MVVLATFVVEVEVLNVVVALELVLTVVLRRVAVVAYRCVYLNDRSIVNKKNK